MEIIDCRPTVKRILGSWLGSGDLAKPLNIMEIPILNKVAKYLDVPVGEIHLDSNQMAVRSIKGKKYTGIGTIILQMTKESKVFQWSNDEEKYHVYQWLEFINQFGYPINVNSPNAKTMLKELNKYMEDCSYLTGFCRTFADIVVYYAIYDLIASLSPSEKEANINICRWFDHIQFSQEVRLDQKPINFTSNYILNRPKELC